MCRSEEKYRKMTKFRVWDKVRKEIPNTVRISLCAENPLDPFRYFDTIPACDIWTHTGYTAVCTCIALCVAQ